MGYPIRSNIFKNGTDEQAYFSRFPVQVAVLFSPNDQEFVEAFRSIFLTLDQLTGDDVAFFAVLDPPQDWLEAAENRQWWEAYREQMGQTRYSMDDRVLVKEIARLFGVGWGELPQIVVSTNLWTGEFVKSPTSSIHLQSQLETLTKLVREWGQPNFGHIARSLSDAFGVETEYHPPDDNLRDRFSTVYRVLEVENNGQFQRILDRELQEVEDSLRRLRQREADRGQRINDQQFDEFTTSTATEDTIEDGAGRLVAPATVAMRVFHRFSRAEGFSIANMLEEESLIMVETALTIGNFLEGLENGSLREITPLRLGNRGRSGVRWQAPDIDFTPGSQGAWKAFELEINLSLIQAARASIFIRMPEFFAIYDSEYRSNLHKIQTGCRRDGTPIYKDINQLDWEAPQTRQHRFLSLGEALHVARAIAGSQEYERVISMCLGQPLPPALFQAWEEVHQVRNKGSHIAPLQHQDYETILHNALSLKVLDPLIKIKSKLSRRPLASVPAIVSVHPDLKRVDGLKREIEAMRDADVVSQIRGYYEKWRHISPQEARITLAKAIIEKVRKAGREKAIAEKTWYKELQTFLEEAEVSPS